MRPPEYLRLPTAADKQKQSTLYEPFIDQIFAAVEREAGVVPFTIGTEEFNQLYLFVDGT
jgi:hypothetical protein